MALKILGNWTYCPKFAENKNMVIVFKRLSATEELTIARGVDEGERTPALLLASIVEIKNPLILEMPDGDQRKLTANDLAVIPELKELFFELLVEHGNKTAVTGETAKKSK